VLERPALAALMGAIVAAWSSAESTLASYYSSLVTGVVLENVPMPPGGWAAMETFDLITNYDLRKRMLESAARRALFTEAEVQEFSKLLKKLNDAKDDRIVVAHGRWGIDVRYSDALVWMKTTGGLGGAWIYDEADFWNALERIERKSLALGQFFQGTFFPRLEASAKFHIEQIVASEQRKNADESV